MKRDKIEPYKPTPCDVHRKRHSVMWLPTGSGEVTENGKVIKPGLATPRHVCQECFDQINPPLVRAVKERPDVVL